MRPGQEPDAAVREPCWPRSPLDQHARTGAASRGGDAADRNVLVITVIEEARAVEHIDEIAAIPGIDVLFIGTSDLSFSLGLRGARDQPRLKDATARIAEAGKRRGKYLGLPLRTAGEGGSCMAQGFSFFQVTTEIGLMAVGARQLLGSIAAPRSGGESRAALRESDAI